MSCNKLKTLAAILNIWLNDASTSEQTEQLPDVTEVVSGHPRIRNWHRLPHTHTQATTMSLCRSTVKADRFYYYAGHMTKHFHTWNVHQLQSSNKKLSYRKETVRLLHKIEIRILHESHIVPKGLFQSNRDHRLTFRRVIIEKWMYTTQVPINNALVLGNLCEYRHKWYIAKN